MLHTFLLLLWVGWVTQAVLSAMQVRKFARRFERPRRETYDAYCPTAAVIVPFKGLEASLEPNLLGLCTQDYPDYRLVFVVESEDDPAYPVLLRCRDRYPQRRIEVLVAGLTGDDEGQKVHNQLAAIRHLQQQRGGEAVWVFADSDAVPGPRWLGELVGPLAYTEKTGVTTGYRWLIPQPRAAEHSPTLWAKLASIMNSSVACFMGRDALNHAWGGSMAMRVETAEEGDLVSSLTSTLSDDYQVSAMCRGLGRRIYFVPGCLVASPVDFSFAEFADFAYRQHLITRIHAPRLYFGGLALHTLFVAGFVSAWAAMGLATAGYADARLAALAAGAIVAVFVANQCRASFRQWIVRNAFGQETVDQLRGTLRLDRWATPLWMGLHWFLILRAGFGRTICWRGIRYRLHAPHRIERLTPPKAAAAETQSASVS